jgi:ABC-2 type transport system permease protein
MRLPLSNRAFATTRVNSRLLMADPAPIVVMMVMPLLLIAFLMPAARAQLHETGYASASGADQVVPGMAVLFAFLSTSMICTLFFREHAWGTWDRLRVSAASSLDLVVGKVAPLYACLLVQMAVVFGIGVVAFGYQPNGSWLALGVIVAVFVATLVLFGVMLVAVFATLDQAQVTGTLGGLVMAGLGGALAPASTLPGWAQQVAHVDPAYWALQVLHDVTLGHAGFAQVAPDLGILVGFAVAFAAVAMARFRPSDAKTGTT